MADNARLQFEVSSSRLQELEILMRKCDISTKKELFNNALTLFEWAVSESESGSKIASINDQQKKVKELQMPPLAAATRSCHKLAYNNLE